jgi:hypothetical protein
MPRDPEPAPPTPQTAEPATERAAAKRRSTRRLRLWIAMIAGVLALLCLGGAGVAVLLYDKKTKIDRTAPDAVVDNFLRAYLVNRDDSEVKLYTCKSGGDLTQLKTYETDIQSREARFSMSVQVSWEGLKVATNGKKGTVDVDLTRAIQDGSEQVTDAWEFAIIDQDGWRVCGASRVS